MSIQSDRWIREMAREHGMIEPFEERTDVGGVISYGLSSYGFYALEGIAQVLFLRGNERCEISYADRTGKYQRQTGITLPRVRGS